MVEKYNFHKASGKLSKMNKENIQNLLVNRISTLTNYSDCGQHNIYYKVQIYNPPGIANSKLPSEISKCK